ncbi:hypothetical protein [Muricauda sp. MAR_2010_75]|uniref:hypothetical protein n=1 Tax=Allomuricauda sp. MAR_2010_75 TaxID=1250232 RepID=UPI0012E08416|nr:hypothetical protein [Muricauda sp. MAR_2010_75]
MNALTGLIILAIIQLLVILYLYLERQNSKNSITTKKLIVGGFVIRIVNGELSIEPRK